MSGDSRELVFVYDADSSTWSKLFDAAHKVISPATYSCSLCALTYGMVFMRREWAEFIRSLPQALRFAYRDQITREHPEVPPLPALLERRDGVWTTLLDKPQIAACKNLDELMTQVREVLR